MTTRINPVPVISAVAVAVSLLVLSSVSAIAGKGPAPVSIDELRTWMENPAVVILDVRQAGDWKNSRHKIKGAVRRNPRRFDDWVSNYRQDQTIVLYCA